LRGERGDKREEEEMNKKRKRKQKEGKIQRRVA
jgi:hypothetical protein